MNDDGGHRALLELETAALARWDSEGGGTSRAPRLAAPWKARFKQPRPADPARDALQGAQILSSTCRDPE